MMPAPLLDHGEQRVLAWIAPECQHREECERRKQMRESGQQVCHRASNHSVACRADATPGGILAAR
jgi:hypothetical protein